MDPRQAIEAASLLPHGQLVVSATAAATPRRSRSADVVNRLVVDFLQPPRPRRTIGLRATGGRLDHDRPSDSRNACRDCRPVCDAWPTPLLPVGYASRRARRRRPARRPVPRSSRRLLRLVRQRRGTRFGRDHDFARIRTVADYQRRVPLRDYEAFWKDYWQPAFPHLSRRDLAGPDPVLRPVVRHHQRRDEVHPGLARRCWRPTAGPR